MAWTQEEEQLYIGGMNTSEDIINMIQDKIDDGDLKGAKDDLEQFKDYLKPIMAMYDKGE